jgi:hypothetical protein
MGSERGPLRRRHSAEKAVPFQSTARRLLNLLSTEGGDTRGWFMKKISRSNVFSLLSANRRLRERLEAENAQLRASVVDLSLRIQALREAIGRPQSEIQPNWIRRIT